MDLVSSRRQGAICTSVVVGANGDASGPFIGRSCGDWAPWMVFCNCCAPGTAQLPTTSTMQPKSRRVTTLRIRTTASHIWLRPGRPGRRGSNSCASRTCCETPCRGCTNWCWCTRRRHRRRSPPLLRGGGRIDAVEQVVHVGGVAEPCGGRQIAVHLHLWRSRFVGVAHFAAESDMGGAASHGVRGRPVLRGLEGAVSAVAAVTSALQPGVPPFALPGIVGWRPGSRRWWACRFSSRCSR